MRKHLAKMILDDDKCSFGSLVGTFSYLMFLKHNFIVSAADFLKNYRIYLIDPIPPRIYNTLYARNF